MDSLVVHRDARITVLDKPPGVSASALAEHFGQPLATPLDEAASGLVVLGEAGEMGLSQWHLGTEGDGLLGEVVEGRGPRRWCAVEGEDIRARARRAGAPIAGTPEGTPHHRALLHRTGFEGMPHRRAASWRAWLDEDPFADIPARVMEAAWRRWERVDAEMVRLVHSLGDGLPGVEIDRYGDWLVVSLHDEQRRHEASLLDALAPLSAKGIYVKRRPKEAKGVGDTRRDDVAPKEAVRGEIAPEPLVLHEGGCPYEVRLGDGLSTGIFLDQRDARGWVAARSEGARVLNTFCYHAAFTVAAVAGGAVETTSIDTARPALDRAADALRRVGAEPSAEHALVRDDTMRFLERAARKGRQFDVIVLDPPSYATNKRGRKRTTWRVVRDYPELIARSLAVLAPDGTILACTNHRQSPAAKVREWLHAGADLAGVPVTLEPLDPPLDYPPAPGQPPHLKRFYVRRLADDQIDEASLDD